MDFSKITFYIGKICIGTDLILAEMCYLRKCRSDSLLDNQGLQKVHGWGTTPICVLSYTSEWQTNEVCDVESLSRSLICLTHFLLGFFKTKGWKNPEIAKEKQNKLGAPHFGRWRIESSNLRCKMRLLKIRRSILAQKNLEIQQIVWQLVPIFGEIIGQLVGVWTIYH